MRRARQTAAPLGRRLGLEPVVVDDVAEYDRNSSEYVPIEELKADGRSTLLRDPRQPWDGADPVEEFEARVTAALDDLIADHAGDTIAVVCHGGVINLFLAIVLGLADAIGPGFFYPNYTSIHRIAASRSGVRSIVTDQRDRPTSATPACRWACSRRADRP